ncbi:hypothetical protein [Syntrophomonas palmitatica]|uniref:hypothetical protein n=1 Tax=Syntrophomonas palmitatica TaxID=402877 RepID=UPI0012EDD7A1|nr:hypothetical protein [Syntrophomonas palmitatica]
MAAASSVLAFSGLSIIAQITGVMAGTPFRAPFYLLTRLWQILLSICITVITFKILAGKEAFAVSALSMHQILYSFDAWSISLSCLATGTICLVLLMIYSWLRSST